MVDSNPAAPGMWPPSASARLYGGLGLAVFPVARDCRRPLTAHGYKDARADPGGIERLWCNRPDANIAVACGAVSGAFVLDVDVKGENGLLTLSQLQTAHGRLPTTWRTRTPGGGIHLWFRQPRRVLRNRVGFAPGLDIRTHGGSVAVPPSHRFDGAYVWEIAPGSVECAAAPSWLLDMIDPPRTVRSPPSSLSFDSLSTAARYLASAVNSEARDVAATPVGSRNGRLFVAAARLGELLAGAPGWEGIAQDHLEEAALASGLSAIEARATIKSGFARGRTSPRDIRL